MKKERKKEVLNVIILVVLIVVLSYGIVKIVNRGGVFFAPAGNEYGSGEYGSGVYGLVVGPVDNNDNVVGNIINNSINEGVENVSNSKVNVTVYKNESSEASNVSGNGYESETRGVVVPIVIIIMLILDIGAVIFLIIYLLRIRRKSGTS